MPLLGSRPALPFEEEAAALTKADVLAKRRRMFCGAQSISYENADPLMAVRGDMQYIVDDEGRRFLDTRNNVGHVGWQHPDVVGAVQRQAAMLNCNQRYLHPNRVLLAERLTATMPPELCVCFLVNSGSEANDLAIRLAKAHTGGTDFIVVDHAYHGHTDTVIDISPYKYGKRNGAGKKPWIHQVRCPDVYRGEHRTRSATAIAAAAKAAKAAAAAGADEQKKEGGDWVTEAEAAERYAAHVGEACGAAEDRKARGEGKGVAAFFIESGMSVAGVILPPDGYLKACYERVRAVNGICVADEVQVRDGLVGGRRGGRFSVKRMSAMRRGYGGFHGWRIQSCARILVAPHCTAHLHESLFPDLNDIMHSSTVCCFVFFHTNCSHCTSRHKQPLF